MTRSRAIIVGAGINGLCTAWALRKRGWAVTVLDQAAALPNTMGASFDHNRLMRGHYAGQPGYAARIPAAHAAWQELWDDLGAAHFVRTGVIAVSETPGDWTDRARTAMQTAGLPHEVIEGPDTARRFGFLAPGRARFTLLTPGDGALLAAPILNGLIDWLGAAGVELIAGAEVAEADPERGRITTRKGAQYDADAVVLAGGHNLARLMPTRFDANAFVSMRSVIMYVTPPPALAAQLAGAPCWVDLGGEDDLWGAAPMRGIAMKLGLGANTGPHPPGTAGRAVTPQEVARYFAAYEPRMPGISASTVQAAIANYYIMAPEARFVLAQDGAIFGLSACSGHGFKFGALTGQDVADAVCGGAFGPIAARVAGHDGCDAAAMPSK